MRGTRSWARYLGGRGQGRERSPVGPLCRLPSRLVIADGSAAVGVTADVTDLAAVQRLRQQAEQASGPAEVVAAFVGGGQARQFAHS